MISRGLRGEPHWIPAGQEMNWSWQVVAGSLKALENMTHLLQFGDPWKILEKSAGDRKDPEKSLGFSKKLRIIKLGIFLFCMGASLENTWSYFICNALQSMGISQETLMLDLQVTMVLIYENCKLIECPENLKGHMTDRHCQPVAGLECPANFLHMFCCWCQMQLFQNLVFPIYPSNWQKVRSCIYSWPPKK